MAVVVLVAAILPAVVSVKSPARAATSCPADGCAVTVDARDFATARDNPAAGQLANFTYIVNIDTVTRSFRTIRWP